MTFSEAAIARGLEALAEGVRREYPGATVEIVPQRSHPRGTTPEGDQYLEAQRDSTTQTVASGV